MKVKSDLTSEFRLDINNFMVILNSNKDFKDESKLRCIVKHIIFFKNLGEDSHYKRFMIYDLLMLMNSLTQNSKRNFYQIYRSLIENFIRFILKLEDTDSTGVRDLFKLLKERFDTCDETEEIITYINGEYGKCCDYVHSNVDAKLDIFQHYKEIVESDEMNEATLNSLINSLLTLVQKLTLFTLITSPLMIDSCFFRCKSDLRFLIGEKNFNKFKENLESTAG